MYIYVYIYILIYIYIYAANVIQAYLSLIAFNPSSFPYKLKYIIHACWRYSNKIAVKMPLKQTKNKDFRFTGFFIYFYIRQVLTLWYGTGTVVLNIFKFKFGIQISNFKIEVLTYWVYCIYIYVHLPGRNLNLFTLCFTER